MKTLQTLIDKACKIAGNGTLLGQKIGLTPQEVNDFRRGRRVVSPEIVGLLCNYLELPSEEAREWLAIAVLENPKNSSRVEVFRKAFFASWVAGILSSALMIQPTDAEATTGALPLVKPTTQDTNTVVLYRPALYIMLTKAMHKICSWLKLLLMAPTLGSC